MAKVNKSYVFVEHNIWLFKNELIQPHLWIIIQRGGIDENQLITRLVTTILKIRLCIWFSENRLISKTKKNLIMMTKI